MKESVIFYEDFETCREGAVPAGWWTEGGERVYVENGRLRVVANPEGDHQPGYVATVWHERVFSGDLKVDFDAHVLHSTVDANNINCFLLYSDPEGRPLYETRASRADGAYRHYHVLNGYIFTFLNDFRHESGRKEAARMRMRRCPGFRLMAETYDYHCRKGVTYHVTIIRRGGHLTFGVDGRIYLECDDRQPWAEGLIGLRTFQTDLWWDNITVAQLG